MRLAVFSPCEKTTPKLFKNYSVSEWKEGWGERGLGGVGGGRGRRGRGIAGWGERKGGLGGCGGKGDRIGWGGGRGMGERGARVFEVPNPMYLTTAGCICLINCAEAGVQTNATNV